jgi:hypothetical protein
VEFNEFWVGTGLAVLAIAVGIVIVLLRITRVIRLALWVIAACLGIVGVGLMLYGWCAGSTVIVSPITVVFANLGDLYSFDVRNEKSADVYSVCVLLTIQNRDYSPKDFTLSIPQDDLKAAVAERPPVLPAAAPDFGDIVEFTCRDGDDRITFLVILPHLKPQESRGMELGLTGGVTVIAKPVPSAPPMKLELVPAPKTTVLAIIDNYQTIEPSINVSATSSSYYVGSKFNLSRPLFHCSPMMFFVRKNKSAHR